MLDILRTRPDTRPKLVADGWAGAIMRVSTLNVIVFNSSVTTRDVEAIDFGAASTASASASASIL